MKNKSNFTQSSFVGGKLKPRMKEHLADAKQNDAAVINYGSPAYIKLDENYKVNGQPVSKG
jgi:hypothetical protein